MTYAVVKIVTDEGDVYKFEGGDVMATLKHAKRTYQAKKGQSGVKSNDGCTI